jgi:hypothetical protein
MHLRYVARTWTAWQEGKLGKALSSVMGRHVLGIAARRVGRREAAQAGTMFARITQTEGIDCHRDHVGGLWLPDPGDCAGV